MNRDTAQWLRLVACVLVGLALGLVLGRAIWFCPPPDPAAQADAGRLAREAHRWRAEAVRLRTRADSLAAEAAVAREAGDAARVRWISARTQARQSVPTLRSQTALLDDDSLASAATRELHRRLRGDGASE